MGNQEMVLWLPWMCAGLVFSIEVWVKGFLMAITVGISSLALFAFVLVVLSYLKSMDDEAKGPSAARTYAEGYEIVFESIRVRHPMFPELSASQDST